MGRDPAAPLEISGECATERASRTRFPRLRAEAACLHDAGMGERSQVEDVFRLESLQHLREKLLNLAPVNFPERPQHALVVTVRVRH